MKFSTIKWERLQWSEVLRDERGCLGRSRTPHHWHKNRMWMLTLKEYSTEPMDAYSVSLPAVSSLWINYTSPSSELRGVPMTREQKWYMQLQKWSCENWQTGSSMSVFPPNHNQVLSRGHRFSPESCLSSFHEAESQLTCNHDVPPVKNKHFFFICWPLGFWGCFLVQYNQAYTNRYRTWQTVAHEPNWPAAYFHK